MKEILSQVYIENYKTGPEITMEYFSIYLEQKYTKWVMWINMDIFTSFNLVISCRVKVRLLSQ